MSDTIPAVGTQITLGSDDSANPVVWTVAAYEDDNRTAVLTRRELWDYNRAMNWTRPITDADYRTITKRVELTS